MSDLSRIFDELKLLGAPVRSVVQAQDGTRRAILAADATPEQKKAADDLCLAPPPPTRAERCARVVGHCVPCLLVARLGDKAPLDAQAHASACLDAALAAWTGP